MITGAILAGGQSRRMGGKAKALLPIFGEAMIERQIRTMRTVCNEIIIIANDEALFTPYRAVDVRIVPDAYPGRGPLAGLHAALKGSKTDTVWAVGCDMPFLSPPAALSMLRWLDPSPDCLAAVPVIGGKIQPLHALYRRECAIIAEQLLAADQLRMMGFLEHISWFEATGIMFKEAGLADLDFTTNMNTPEDYDRWTRGEITE